MDRKENPRSSRGRGTVVYSDGSDPITVSPEDSIPEPDDGTERVAIQYSRGRDAFDAYPEQRSAASFEAFAEAVLADRATAKGLTWISAPFKPNSDGRHHRCRDGALPRRFLAFDLDGGTREAAAELGLYFCGYSGFWYTTSSHTAETPRLRYVLELTRPVDRAEGIRLGEAIQRQIEARLGLGVVKLDASVYRGEQPIFGPLLGAETMRYDGDPVDVDAVLKDAPPLEERPQGRPTSDPYRVALLERGLVLRELGPGKDAIACPFAEDHSEATSQTATVYFWPRYGGYQWGRIHCLHAHCAGRNKDQRLYLEKLGLDPREVWREQAAGAGPYDDLPPVESYDEAAQEGARRGTANAKAPAGSEARLGNSEGMRTGTRIHHDRTVTLGELFEEPEESEQWLVEGLFPAAGFSVLAAKPKVGKSTLARQLALAVARGEPFLERETTKGSVLYVALEEKRAQVRAHFRAMGAGGDESIHIYVASAPENAIAWLSHQIELVHPVLVIIDPLFRLARVRDTSAYAEGTAAMEPLLGLARTTGAHVLVTHHTTKRGEGSDAILGSTAIFGSVDTAAVLVRSERYRSIATTQRYGEDLPETVLAWDPDTRTASLGGTREEAEIDRLGKEILAYLSDKNEPVTEALIDEQIEGRTGPKKKALRVLVRDKRVTRIGEGKRGEPFLYVCSSVVPTYTGEPGNQKPKDDLSGCAAGGYSGSQDHADPRGSGNQQRCSGNQQHGAKPDAGSWETPL
jgi:hypothetical protein